SNATIPSKTANSIHIMEMCAALKSFGHTVMLFANISGNSKADEIFRYYGIKDTFTIYNRLSFINIRFLAHLNGLYMALKAKLKQPDFIIGRDITSCFFSALFGLDVYFETHGPMVESGRLSHFMFKKIIKKSHF